MSFWDKVVDAFEGFERSKEVVDAYNDLPPTYNTGDDVKFDQFVPDPVTEQGVQNALDRVDQAEKDWQDWKDKHDYYDNKK